MATLVAAQAAAGIQPRAIHAGVNSVYSVYSLTATLSAGDIIQMCKLPDRARIIDVQLSVNVGLGAAGKLNVGTRSDHDQLIASASVVTALRVFTPATGNTITPNAIGLQYDISDDATTRYTMIEVKASDFTGTGTKSGAIALMIQYQLDQ